MKLSDIGNLNWQDFVKGAFVAVAGAVLIVIQQSITSHTGIDWVVVEQVAEGSFLSYLIKNYFTDSQGKFAGVI